ncbi:uncharacterized protein L203_103529 [Cryptococcus depauperatus CBS 7841]|uniref:Uncharacterized protein n=1 Tax=Cryptococcus depauperatus CBS 7841 TaxID=1295531 RepID=A0A1E3II37_9TREE|nr:hypothetical protein L203_02876 [Cryptococcus depauperatus CBS 7841]ODN97613.1 hypothetical protein L204_03032 [Cryptococcus depauperatus CBS 7855]
MFGLEFGQAPPQVELARLKQAPALNPNYNMVIKYLDCLNRLADHYIPLGNLAAWLIEVQLLIQKLQKRVYSRIHLTPVERKSLLNFATYWRNMTRPPYNMGRPEAQIVMITLIEFAQR